MIPSFSVEKSCPFHSNGHGPLDRLKTIKAPRSTQTPMSAMFVMISSRPSLDHDCFECPYLYIFIAYHCVYVILCHLMSLSGTWSYHFHISSTQPAMPHPQTVRAAAVRAPSSGKGRREEPSPPRPKRRKAAHKDESPRLAAHVGSDGSHVKW